MVLTDKQCKEIRKQLDNCKRPLFFFDDDPDGMSSFILLYKYKGEGKGLPVKSAPIVDEKFIYRVEEYQPDLVVIVDVPMVDQDFLDAVKVPVLWIDHHGPYERQKVKYYNPRVNDPKDNSSTAINCYKIANNKKDLWIGMVGGVGDWQLPYFTKEFANLYPDFLDKDVKRPEDALFDSKLGKLIKMVSFMLKGRMSDVMKCIKILTRVEHPNEIFKGETPRAKFLLKHISSIYDRYDDLLRKAKRKKTKSEILKFTYTDSNMSFTKELSNELLYLYPDKLIVVGRIKGGDVKLSTRTSKRMLPPLIEGALEGVEGYGGGHEHACGACVKEDDFDQFLKQLKEQLD